MTPALEALKKAHETGVLYEHNGSDREMREAWEEATGYTPERMYYAIPEAVLQEVLLVVLGKPPYPVADSNDQGET